MKFCANCGNPLESDSQFCAACGTPVGDELQPENLADNNFPQTESVMPEPEVQTVPQQPIDDFGAAEFANDGIGSLGNEPATDTVSSNDFQQPEVFTGGESFASFDVADTGKGTKKSKLKTKIIAIATAICVLCVSVVALYFFVPSFKNWVIKTFASPSDYLGYVLEKNLTKVSDAVDFVDSTYDMNMKLTLDDSVSSLLSYLDMDEDIADGISDFDSAELDASMTFKETQLGLSASGRINKTNIGDTDIACDFKGKMGFIDLNKLSETSFGFEIDDDVSEGYMIAAAIFGKGSNQSKNTKKLITEYVKMILSDLSVKKGSENLETENLSKKYTTLSFKVDGKESKRIWQDILEKAKNDDDLLELIIEMNKNQGGSEITKGELKILIKQEFDRIKNTKSLGNFEFKVTFYVDGDSNIKGLTIKENEHDIEYLHIADVESKKEFETEIRLADVFDFPGSVSVVGSGTVNGKKRTGEYEGAIINPFTDESLNICTVSLTDWATDSAEGRLSIRFSEDCVENVLKSMPFYYRASRFGRETISMALKNIEIYIEVEKSEKDSFAGSIGLDFSGIDALKLEITSSRKDAEKVKFPDDYTDDFEYWTDGIDVNFGKLFKDALNN